MNISNVLIIDNNKSTKKIILSNNLEFLIDIPIDLATSEKNILDKLQKMEYSIIMINSELQWMKIVDLMQIISKKHPFSGVILFSYNQVNPIVDGKKLKMDAVINYIENRFDNISYAFEFALERANERRDLYYLNEEYQELFNNVPIGLYRTDFRGKILASNTTFANILGFENEYELNGLFIQDFYYNEFNSNESQLSKIFSAFPFTKGVRKLKKKNSDVIWVEIDTKSTIIDNVLVYLNGTVKDITDTKNTEYLLQKKEEYYQKLVQTSPDAIALIDLEGKIQFINQQFLEMFNFNEENEIIDQCFFNLINNSNQNELLEAFYKTIEKNSMLSFEIELIKNNGATFPAEININFVKDENNKPNGIIAITRDITERKWMEQEIRKERNTLQQYLDVAGVIFLAIDSKGNISLINRKGCEVLKCEEERYLGKNWFDNFIPEKCRSKVKEKFKQLINENHNSYNYYENPIISKDGEERLIAWYNTCLVDEEGNVIGILSSGNDITERKKAEKALVESENKFRELFNKANDAIVLIDISDDNVPGKFIEVNDIACKRYGYNRSELLNLTMQDIVAPKRKEMIPKIIDNLKEKRSITYESLHIDRNCREIPTDISSHIILFDDKEHLLSIMRDITDRKEAELQLKNSEEMYRLIFENSGNSIIVINDNFGIKVCNSNFEKLINCKKEDIEGNDWRKYVFENDLEKIVKIANDLKNFPILQPQEMNFRIVDSHRNIKTVWAIVNLIPNKKEAVVSIHDVTEKTVMNEVKRQAFDQLDKNLLQFATIVDSIRNPLAVIVALADVQNNELSKRIVEQAELIDRILLRLDERSLESINVRNFIQNHIP